MYQSLTFLFAEQRLFRRFVCADIGYQPLLLITLGRFRKVTID